MAFSTIPVRFFVVDFDNQENDIYGPELVEVSEHVWLKHDGRMSYERHTVRENGVSQICLYKGLEQC